MQPLLSTHVEGRSLSVGHVPCRHESEGMQHHRGHADLSFPPTHTYTETRRRGTRRVFLARLGSSVCRGTWEEAGEGWRANAVGVGDELVIDLWGPEFGHPFGPKRATWGELKTTKTGLSWPGVLPACAAGPGRKQGREGGQERRGASK